MTSGQMVELAAWLARKQTGGGMFHDGMAPFTVRFGYISETSGVCKHDGIVITDAPPRLLYDLIEWREDQSPTVSVHVGYGGLLVL